MCFNVSELLDRFLYRVLDRVLHKILRGTVEEHLPECESDLQRTGEGFSAGLSDILFLPLIKASLCCALQAALCSLSDGCGVK